MAPSGESHSIFVVQQTFARVRRGYDPDEVDRHLELVAEMFRRGPDLELRRELQRREAAIGHELEAAKMEAEATVEGARRRAAADTAAAAEALAAARCVA
jgi:DivIVA domain-containing protein